MKCTQLHMRKVEAQTKTWGGSETHPKITDFGDPGSVGTVNGVTAACGG
jgi:hypothetical protein